MAIAPTVKRAPLASAHDLELVALGAAGDRAAFGELVRRHGAAVRGLLRRMGADGATGDDVAQDAFLAAFEQIAEFRGEGAFRAWVCRIAARLYVKGWRRQARADLLAEGGRVAEADSCLKTVSSLRLSGCSPRRPRVPTPTSSPPGCSSGWIAAGPRGA